jgi:lysozyme
MAQLRDFPKPPQGNVEAPKPVLVIPQAEYLSVDKLHPSDFAISWMKRFEGLRLEAYSDRGTPAIGWGHNATSKRPPLVTMGMKITLEDAQAILAQDAEAIAAEVRKVLKGVMLKQHQFDALVLDCFQRGQTQFTKTNVVELLKHGLDASDAFHAQSEATKDPGLKRRRKVEAQIFDGDKPTKW